MLRTAARLFTTATVALVLAAGAQPAHAVGGPAAVGGPVAGHGSAGFLCTLLGFRCP